MFTTFQRACTEMAGVGANQNQTQGASQMGANTTSGVFGTNTSGGLFGSSSTGQDIVGALNGAPSQPL